jgi:hypothetical protein
MFGLSINSILGAVAGAAVTILLGGIYDVVIDDPAVRRTERALVQAEARQRALDLIEQRSKDNAEISTFDLQRFCRELGGRWVQSDCVD